MNTQQAQNQAAALAQQGKQIGNTFSNESAVVRQAAEAAYNQAKK